MVRSRTSPSPLIPLPLARTVPQLHLRLLCCGTIIAAGACAGRDGPTSGADGTLTVTIAGVPTAGDVRVDGPSGFSRLVTQTTTLGGLRRGDYRVEARQVAPGEIFLPSQPVQMVSVSGEAASVTVLYAQISGALAITTSGAPPGTVPDATVRGPGGFSTEVSAPRTLRGLLPGQYWVVPKATFAGSCALQTPDSTAVQVAVEQTARVALHYALHSYGGYNMCIESAYLVQSVQTRTGTVPLVYGRDALLRVFVRGNIPFAAFPTVRARFLESGAVIHTELIAAPGAVPTTPDEANGSSTWNAVIPGPLIRPSVSVIVEVDPDEQVIGEVERSDNTYPRDGAPRPLDSRDPRPLHVRLIPVMQTNTGNVTQANAADFLWVPEGLLPVSGVHAEVALPFQTQVPEITSDNGNGSWQLILQELEVKRLSEQQGQGFVHYVGVLRPGYASGTAGMAYVRGWSSLVWDHLNSRSASWVLAHELGHNWGRLHVTGCNQSISGIDPAYPHSGGSIGVYGHDLRTGTIYTPARGDIMSYCNSQWISDYNFAAIMTYRGYQTSATLAAAAAREVEVMLVWGAVGEGRITLQPVFVTWAAPSLPSRPGRHRLEGVDASGATLFSFSFDPLSIAHSATPERHFAFAVPLTASVRQRIAGIRVTGGGAHAVRTLGSNAPRRALDELRVRGATGEAMDFNWDATASEALLVRDVSTRSVIAILRGGAGRLIRAGAELDVVAADAPAVPPRRIANPQRR